MYLAAENISVEPVYQYLPGIKVLDHSVDNYLGGGGNGDPDREGPTWRMLCLGCLCHIQNRVRFVDNEKENPISSLTEKNQAGFTLIEIIAVLVILSVIGAISFTKAEALSETATLRVIEDAIRELNSREMVTWANIKLSDPGWTDDPTVFASMDVNLGLDFHWGPIANPSGGNLRFKDMVVTLSRVPSQKISSGRWKVDT